jgi:hypothetical protein
LRQANVSTNEKWNRFVSAVPTARQVVAVAQEMPERTLTDFGRSGLATNAHDVPFQRSTTVPPPE